MNESVFERSAFEKCYCDTPEHKSKMKKTLEDLLKKYPYGWDVFYLRLLYEGEEKVLTHYSEHFFVKDDFLEINDLQLQIPWENVIEIKFWDYYHGECSDRN